MRRVIDIAGEKAPLQKEKAEYHKQTYLQTILQKYEIMANTRGQAASPRHSRSWSQKSWRGPICERTGQEEGGCRRCRQRKGPGEVKTQDHRRH